MAKAKQEGSSSLTSFHESSLGLGSPYPWLRSPRSEEGGLQLIELLGECASHVIARCLHSVNTRLEHISYLASPKGTIIQRIASYFIEAFADRMLKGFTGLFCSENMMCSRNRNFVG